MEWYVILLIIVIIAMATLYVMAAINKKLDEKIKDNEEMPYKLTEKILTNKEQKFYNDLRAVAEPKGYIILMKVRLADIAIVPGNTKNRTKWFNIIKSKHIDFLIVDQDMNIKYGIEVDDRTHERKDRQDRDETVNKIFNKIGVQLLRYKIWTKELIGNDIV